MADYLHPNRPTGLSQFARTASWIRGKLTRLGLLSAASQTSGSIFEIWRGASLVSLAWRRLKILNLWQLQNRRHVSRVDLTL